MKLFLVVAVLMTIIPMVRAESECDDPAAAFDDWFGAAMDQLLGDERLVRATDAEWPHIYKDFADYVLEIMENCAESESAFIDFTYEGMFSRYADPNSTADPDVVPSVQPIDVDLDDSHEWLVELHIGSAFYGSGMAFTDVLYWDEESWMRTRIWPVQGYEDLTHDGPQPVSIFIHEQADAQNRTYMGMHFLPGIGPDLYVGGLAVIRWDEWQPQVILFVEQGCVFGAWERGPDGGLYIPTSSSIPWEGCTAPQGALISGIQVPDAEIPAD